MRKIKIFIPALIFTFLIFLQSLQAQNQAPPEWAVCSACHTIGKGKLIGPDLMGVNDRHDEAWLLSFIRASQTMVKNGDPIAVKLFEENNKIPMPDNNLSDEQIKGILRYIKNYQPGDVAEVAATQTTPVESTGSEQGTEALTHRKIHYGTGDTQPTFIVFIILFLIAIFDLVFTKFIKAHFIHIIIILVSIFVLGEIAYVEATSLGRQQGYSPDQPVWFSHKVHVTQNKIDCIYCHSTAFDSKSAGIPGTNVCMNCHNVVKKGTRTGEVEIAKVLESWSTGKPVEWVRVHNLPDHVFFSHAQHVNAGKRQCQECHGPVGEMDRIVQVQDLSMGWCIGCHRKTPVQFETNGFYEKYVKYHDQLKSGEKVRVTVDDIGGNNCQTCHY